jgi:hypothetical protein
MSDQFYFSRDTKLVITLGSGVFEVPILDGFSFSQAQNIQDITFNEAADADGTSNRAREAVVNSIAPAEWSFQTYIRPFKTSGTDTPFNADKNGGANKHHLVEEVLWALLVGADTYQVTDSSTDPAFTRGGSDVVTFATSTNGSSFNFTHSNKTTLGTADFTFMLGAHDASTDKVYKISDCVVNEVSIDFDLEGIATASWSGFGTLITDENTNAPTVTVSEDINATDNMIRNRLSRVKLVGNNSTGAGTVTHEITLTGGNITISNNITYLTPEILGQVNTPLGHVTGTRTVSGSLTCYLNDQTNGSTHLFEDIIEDNKSLRKNSYALDIFIGGESGSDVLNGPGMKFSMGTCHLEIPTHSFEDIISTEVNFHALPSTVAGTNEITDLAFKGA